MSELEKTFTGILAFIFILGGAGVTMYGMFRVNETGDKSVGDQYIIPAQILDALTIIVLLYMTMTNSGLTPLYKTIIIVLLVGGLVGEIYLTSYSDRKIESITSYIVIALNFLIRVFFLIELSKSGIVNNIVAPMKPAQQAVKEAIKQAIAPAAPKAEGESYSKIIQDKWIKLKSIIEATPEGLDKESESKAWVEVVNKAKKQERSDVVSVLKEAVALMKDKQGNPIPQKVVDSVGGARK